MSKTFTSTYKFNIETDEQFSVLANAFGHAMTAVEEQGYSVPYGGRDLFHPGQIAVQGRSGIGKSSFFNEVMQAFAPQDAQVNERLQPSADESRTVQVWKRWVSDTERREVRIEDLEAVNALSHLPDTHLPDRDMAGISIMEHALDAEELGVFDMLLVFNYDDGRRVLEVKTTQEVAESSSFQEEFLPLVEDLQL